MAKNKMEEILEYLRTRTETSAPTVREVAQAIGMSVDTTRHMLIVLKDRGYITWEPGNSPALTVQITVH
jgi:DNA-binding IclR family transcriptional regulator